MTQKPELSGDGMGDFHKVVNYLSQDVFRRLYNLDCKAVIVHICFLVTDLVIVDTIPLPLKHTIYNNLNICK